MNIGIITFTEGTNYGNKLQNLALLRFLSNNFNCNVFTVKNKVSTLSYKNRIIDSIKKLVPTKKHIYTFLKQNVFNNFNRKYLNYTRQTLTEKTVKFPEIDMFVCGSDQIWNPFYFVALDKFVGKIENKLSISYAASFGVENVLENKKEKYKEELKYLSGISLREENGLKICHELGIDNCLVHIDPTMLITCEEWSSLVKKPKFLNDSDKYVVTYFLSNKLSETEEVINNYCLENNLKRIDLNNLNDKKAFTVDPLGFLYLIKNAEFMFTDSFHGSVFSIIFSTKFLVFDRLVAKEQNMNSRLETLLKKFSLNNHYYCDFNGDYNSLSINNDLVEKILIEERKKSKEYFEKFIG